MILSGAAGVSQAFLASRSAYPRKCPAPGRMASDGLQAVQYPLKLPLTPCVRLGKGIVPYSPDQHACKCSENPPRTVLKQIGGDAYVS